MNDITALMQQLVLAAAKGCCQTLLPDDCRALVEALEKAPSNNSAPAILRQLAEEKQKRGEVAAATAFNYAASALQKELSK